MKSKASIPSTSYITRTLPKRIESSKVVLNFLSVWFKISKLSLLCIKDFFNHSEAYVAGSIIRGVLMAFKI